jgi:hypothetical protein
MFFHARLFLVAQICDYPMELGAEYIQGDQKVSVHLMITIQKVTSNVQSAPASLQTFIHTPNCVLEDRVQYSTAHIPNVFCDGRLQIINRVGIVRIH